MMVQQLLRPTANDMIFQTGGEVAHMVVENRTSCDLSTVTVKGIFLVSQKVAMKLIFHTDEC